MGGAGGRKVRERRRGAIGASPGRSGVEGGREKRERSGESERDETRSDRIPGKVNFY